ncbi:hypothetical protein DYD21_16720 [Rhodohalobacter sp. SW132]|uniref:LVIVD repeat-containing protein n=1 Tax=Rhodohalobacter sp. SW132 TaxID=2293433 RepID=UPI000E2610FD|nr:hypothetical protein [Rhodohalobacter sp. SW132]REL24804.1 hypothetical protein DYD21_16720 [Rhodohalobacter sp. SW132]
MKTRDTSTFRQPVLSQFIIGTLLLIFLPLFLTSCNDKQVQTVTWTEFEPVYMTHSEFVNSVALEESRDLNNPGKFYFYGGYLFVNEVNKGVHIIDNHDPSAPQNVGFINIPANKDIAVDGTLLYADSQKDLLVFDISDLSSPELVQRIEDVFNTASRIAPGFTTQSIDDSKGLVVDWKQVEREEICESNCNSQPTRWGTGWVNTTASFDASRASMGESSGGGVGGSMARFAITSDHLYAVDHTSLTAFSLGSGNTSKVSQQNVGWQIETIFPYQDNLFIGSANAMYIYALSNPSNPEPLSVYWHATACDPVVVEGEYAFVTLRKSEACPMGVNQLDVVDVKDLTNPKKVKSYGMINPHGLGIDNGKLFISEGDHGLKIMDASDPHNVKLLRHIEDIKTFDVIPYDGVLMVTGDDGIIQYDYSDINNLKHLSTIPVFKTEPSL